MGDFMIGLIILGIVVLVILGIIGWIIAVYNRLVGLNNAIENSLHQIQVAMKKRFDMIGQLVDTTKSYMKYEKSVFTDVTKLRSIPLKTPDDLKNANQMATGLLGRIYAVMENYPELKSMDAVKELEESIRNVEAEIARQRYLYNDQVQSFNVLIQVFPNNLIAGMLGFTKKPYLEFGKEIENRPNTTLY